MNTTLNINNVDAATAAAAQIIWDNLACQVGSKKGTSSKLKTAVMAVYGITWGGNFLTVVSTDRICNVLALLRNSSFPRKEYDRLADFLKGGYSASNDFPPVLLESMAIAQQLRLELSHGWGALLAVATFLFAHGIPAPLQLAQMSAANIQPLLGLAPDATALATSGQQSDPRNLTQPFFTGSFQFIQSSLRIP